MKKPGLNNWDRYYLRILLLEVCDVEESIRISDLLRHERLAAYVQADLDTFRSTLRAAVVMGLIFQRGKTSGKVYRTTALGQASIALFRQYLPDFPAYSTLGRPPDFRST